MRLAGDLLGSPGVGKRPRQQPLGLGPQVGERRQGPGRVAAVVGEAHGAECAAGQRGVGQVFRYPTARAHIWL